MDSIGGEQTDFGRSNPPASEENSKSIGEVNTVGGGSPTDPSSFGEVLASSGILDSGPGKQARYTVLEPIGEGGMGTVLKVYDKYLKRTLAMKRIRPDLAASERARERFLAEARAIAAVNHFNVVQIFDVGSDRDGPFILMEYIENESLAKRIERAGAYELREGLHVFEQICAGVEAAHEKGIIHRDIKPGNILLTKRGTPKVGDFGLAHVESRTDGATTLHGTQMGTLIYASPEQLVSGRLVDERADIYALGATLYHMLVGEPPRAIRPERIPDVVRPFLLKALEENPLHRFSTVAEFREALAVGQTIEDRQVERPVHKDVSSPLECHSCGELNKPEVRFCVNCGESLSYYFETCPACRTEGRLDVIRFCGGCGLDLLGWKNLKAAFETAKTYATKGELEDAIKTLAPTIETFTLLPHTPSSLIKSFSDQLQQWKDSVALVDQYRTRGRMALERRNPEDAEDAWKLLLKILPSDEEAQERLQQVEVLRLDLKVEQLRTEIQEDLSNGRGKSARSKWQELLSLRPGDEWCLEREAEVEEARQREEQQQEVSAIETEIRLASRQRDHREVFRLAKVLHEKGALSAELRALGKESYDILKMAQELRELGHQRRLDADLDGAVKAYEEAQELDSKDTEHVATLVSLREAVKLCARLDAASSRSDHNAVRSIGVELSSLGLVTPRAASLLEASKTAFERAQSLCAQAIDAFRGRKNVSEAASLIGQAYALAPLDPEINRTRTQITHASSDISTLYDAWVASDLLGASDVAQRLIEMDLVPAEMRKFAEKSARAPFQRDRRPILKGLVAVSGVVLMLLFGIMGTPNGRPTASNRSNPGNIPNTPLPSPSRGPSMKIVNSIGMDLVLVVPIESDGSEGVTEESDGINTGDTESVRTELGGPFYIGVYEVTQAQYREVMGVNPSTFAGDDFPVEGVTWQDADDFCRRLTLLDGAVHRLPREAEWEYVCRAGKASEFWEMMNERHISEYAWCASNSQGTTHPVGQKVPNAWGIYDMLGNVWEWCSAKYVYRGGGWTSSAEYCRPSSRMTDKPEYAHSRVGFRVLRDL
ncbi:MAG: Serine/threonine-protein kinase PknD [bacterium]|nr:Serine/threonine-protein kinase PknD [bacterium]